MKKGYIFKKLSYQIEGKLSISKLVVNGINNKIPGFTNEYIVEGQIKNLDLVSNEKDNDENYNESKPKYISYIFAPESNFNRTERKRFNNNFNDNNSYTMIYELSELVEGEEIIFKAQYFTNTGEKSEIFETKVIVDTIEPESRLYLFSENGSNVGFSNDLNLKIEVKADEDTREFLLDSIED